MGPVAEATSKDERLANRAGPLGRGLLGILIGGASTAFLLKVGGLVAAYGEQVLLARLMGVTEYGRYAYAAGWQMLLGILGGFGMRTVLLRFIPTYSTFRDYALLKGVVRVANTTVVIGGLLLAALVTAGYWLFGGSFSRPGGMALLIAFWSAPLISLAQLEGAVLQTKHRIALAVGPFDLGRHALIIIAVTAATVLFGLSARSGVVMAITAVILLCVLAWLFAEARKALPERNVAAAPTYQTSEWVKIGLTLLLVSGFSVFIARSDVIMVGIFLTPENVGVFNVASRTAAVGSMSLLAVNIVASPTFAKLHAANDQNALKRLNAIVTNVAFWPALFLFVAFWIWGGRLLAIFGSDFIVGKTQLLILATGHVVSASFGLVGVMLNLTGFQRITAWVYGVSAVLNVALNLILIPRFGAVGAACATTATMIMWNISLYIGVRNKLGVNTFLGAVVWNSVRKHWAS